MARQRVDSLTVVALGFLLFFVFNIIKDRNGGQILDSTRQSGSPLAMSLSIDLLDDTTQADELSPEPTPPAEPLDTDIIASPYDHYELTQGPHGFTYGQMAVDISAGKGAVIRSPINGWVTALFVDDLGNTTLIIENDHYQIMMLHGLFDVTEGEQVSLGQPVGVESNQGNTKDALGRSCRGRDCGYHLHLNIFDKLLGANVNPLELLGDTGGP